MKLMEMIHEGRHFPSRKIELQSALVDFFQAI